MNILKKIIFCIIISTLLPAKMNATAQENEVIFIDGKRYELLSYPIEADSVIIKAIKELKTQPEITKTSLWRGYKGYWSIKNNSLYLDSLQYESPNEKIITIIPKKKKKFKEYKDKYGIKASWFSGELWVATGDYIGHAFNFYDALYENEMLLTVKEGVVTDSKDFKNEIICANKMRFGRNVREAFDEAFRKEFPYAAPVSVRLSYSQINEQGEPTDVKIIFEDQIRNKEEIEAFIRSYLLKNHILGIFKIHDEIIFVKYYMEIGILK